MKNLNTNNVVNLFEKKNSTNGDLILPNKMYPINPLNIVSQTDKAICFNGKIKHASNLDVWNFTMSCWFPKSMLVGVFLPGWLFISKAKDARNGLFNVDRFIELSEQEKVFVNDFFFFVDEYVINLDADFLE